MTDNDIKKALEDKTHKAVYPWVDSSYCDIEVSLLKNALDLINRLQADKEQLEKDKEKLVIAYTNAHFFVQMQSQENLTLKKEIERLKALETGFNRKYCTYP